MNVHVFEVTGDKIKVNGDDLPSAPDYDDYMTPSEFADYCGYTTAGTATQSVRRAIEKKKLPDAALILDQDGKARLHRAIVTEWRDKVTGGFKTSEAVVKIDAVAPPSPEYVAERLHSRFNYGHPTTTIGQLCSALSGAKIWRGKEATATIFRPAIRAAIKAGTIIRQGKYVTLPDLPAAPQQPLPPGPAFIPPAPPPVAIPVGDDFEAKVAAIRACNQRIASLEQCLIAEKATREKLVNSL